MNGRKNKPLCSVSLDLDNQWSYMKTHGDPGWESFPSYLGAFIPMVLDVLERLRLKITFFVVGQDAALEKNKEAIASITTRGHEIGNHSFHHEPWLHLYPREQIEGEINHAEECLVKVTGCKPCGFRGPGFSWSPTLLEVLAGNDYLFDASTLPTYIGPLARAYYFMTGRLSEQQKKDRARLFGDWTAGLRPIKPYYWQLGGNIKLLEIPVSTIPFIKMPFHMSYLLYLGRYSKAIMNLYLGIAITLCRISRTEPSFLLHPLDLLSKTEVPELTFFPGMDISSDRKLEYFETALRKLSKHFRLVSMSVHARAILHEKHLKSYSVESGRTNTG
jgi:peptidoglycan/xylan/chitin deacetylase (PgdA/CDA1 family)